MRGARVWLVGWLVGVVALGCGAPLPLDADGGSDGGADARDAAADAPRPIDARTDDAPTVLDVGSRDAPEPPDGGVDAAEVDAGLFDANDLDAGAADAGASDAGTADAGTADAGTADAGTADAGTADAGAADAGTADAGAADAGPRLPTSCLTTPECGASASCVLGRCVCNASFLPCGTTCCAFGYARDVTLAASGHAPEIAFDAAGNVSVLFQVGTSSVRLATLLAGATTATTEVVATSSGRADAADVAVAPDGTVLIAVHQPGVDPSASFNLLSRAPGAPAFTSTSLRPAPPPAFAFDAAVSISRAPGGDLYAGVAARSGGGTMGLAMARFDASTSAWASLTTIRGAGAYSRSELFARDDGFFVGLHDFTTSVDSYESFTSGATSIAFLAAVTSVTTYGESAAAMTDGGLLYTFTGRTTNGVLDRSDGIATELVTFAGMAAGARSEIDMALDADGNPAIVVHSATSHNVSLMVRMPAGGFTRYSWADSRILPPATTSSWMTLDAERLPNGNIAIVIGDAMDRGELHFMEITR